MQPKSFDGGAAYSSEKAANTKSLPSFAKIVARDRVAIRCSSRRLDGLKIPIRQLSQDAYNSVYEVQAHTERGHRENHRPQAREAHRRATHHTGKALFKQEIRESPHLTTIIIPKRIIKPWKVKW